MRKLTVTLILLTLVLSAMAQRKRIDTLRAALNKSMDDTTRINILLKISHEYYISNPDSNIMFSLQSYELAEKYGLELKKARALNNMATGYASLGDYAKATQMIFKALRVYQKYNDVKSSITEYNNLGDAFIRQGDYKKGLDYLLPANKQWKEYLLTHKITSGLYPELGAVITLNISECYLYTHKIDSAAYYLQLCYHESKERKFTYLINNIDRDLGEIELARGHSAAALKYLRTAINLSASLDDPQMESMSYLGLAKLYHNNKQQDSAEYYALKALDAATAGKFEQDVLNAGKVLYTYYDEDHNLPLAYKYYRLSTAAKDTIYSQEKVKQLLSLDFEEKQHQQEIVAAQQQYRDKVRMYSLIAGLVVVLMVAIVFWRNSSQRKMANRLLQKQKEEIQNTLAELQLTQTQLVQREKMASLGELTAGIAHEIQNPLNFVNNFSEVTAELSGELKEELKKGRSNEAIAIAADIEQNARKIQHHGKRADFIVKGMLEHSRTSTGERQLTNINVLAEEFLKLSYHGLRAKDKAFNANLVTDFDDKLPKINIVQQDIGRVLINLFNNAFYAVNQRSKTAGKDYKPSVEVNTSTQNGFVVIKVKDNGNGVPDAIKDKIMQPFFTTKPTGEGTGLGLSLSYDIIVKGHAGIINVDTKEGEFTEFTVSLPISSV